jgi:hypothetical protein
MIEAKAFRTFIRVYSLYNRERLSNNFKLTLNKALIGSVKTYVCPRWKFEAETSLLKLQRLQKKVLRTTGNFSSRLQLANLMRLYEYVTTFCRQQAEII